jgi:hypothetical protein
MSMHPYLSLEWIAARLNGQVIEGHLGKRSVLANVRGASTEVRLSPLEDDVSVHCAKKDQQAAVEAEVRRFLDLAPKANPNPGPKPANDNAKPAATKPKGRRKATFVRASDVQMES